MDPRPAPRTAGALARLHQLEWRYDGPVPADALHRLEATPAELAGRIGAADAALLDRLARDAVRGMALNRRLAADGLTSSVETHAAALRLAAYRRAGLAARTPGVVSS